MVLTLTGCGFVVRKQTNTFHPVVSETLGNLEFRLLSAWISVKNCSVLAETFRSI